MDRVSSLPSRERGLKFAINDARVKFALVAPFAGAWIEITMRTVLPNRTLVAPFAGAWIEIIGLYSNNVVAYSRSLRGSVD